jgi:hypothetical protein
MGQALSGISASLQPLIDGALGIACPGQMMRQEFRLLTLASGLKSGD